MVSEDKMNEKEMRLGLYRKIEVARKQLPAMDDVAFRQLLLNEFGVSSRKEMTVNQLSRLTHIMAGMGVKFTAPEKTKKREVKPHSREDWIEITDSMPFAAEKRQIAAIWRKLGYSLNSLDTRVKRAFGVHCFAWLKDGKSIGILLSDLQRREKSFDKKMKCQNA